MTSCRLYGLRITVTTIEISMVHVSEKESDNPPPPTPIVKHLFNLTEVSGIFSRHPTNDLEKVQGLTKGALARVSGPIALNVVVGHSRDHAAQVIAMPATVCKEPQQILVRRSSKEVSWCARVFNT